MGKTWWFAIVLVAGVGCVQSTSIRCDSGVVCPAGLACDEVHASCVRPTQLTSCVGKTDGMACTIELVDDGLCAQEVCLEARCGDGFISGAEQCDGEVMPDPKFKSCKDGFGYHDDGVVTCTPQCTFDLRACTRVCGDGVLDREETCDGSALGQYTDCRELGFYDQGALTCTGACTYDTTSCHRRCGDGILDPEELCDGAPPALGCTDYGYDAGFATCTAICAPDIVGSCLQFGWRRLVIPEPVYMQSTMTLGDTLYAGMTDGYFMTYKPGAATLSYVDATDAANLESIWVNSPTDIFAATDVGAILHFDGTSWSYFRPTTGTGNDHVLWGAAANNIYLFQDNLTRRWNGTAWSVDSSVPVFGYVKDAWGTAANDIYVATVSALYHYNGTSWSTVSVPTLTTFLHVGGAGTAMFVTGRDANSDTYVIRRIGGGAWTSYKLASLSPGVSIAAQQEDMLVRAADDAWLVDGQYVYHFDGAAWTLDARPTKLDAIGAVGTEVVAGGFDPFSQTGENVVFHGTSLIDLRAINSQVSELPYTASTAFTAATAKSSSDIWVAGEAETSGAAVPASVHHFDGTEWTTTSLTSVYNPISGVHEISPTEVYATVRNMGVYLYKAGSWQQDTNGTVVADPYGIWGTDATHLWAVGAGAIYKRTGSGWALDLDVSATTDTLFAITGRSATDVWAVGNAAVYHYNGTAWQLVDNGGGANLHAVWTAPGADVFVAGDKGVVRRFDGTAWTTMASGTPFLLRGLFGHAQDDVFAVGSSSTVIHFDGTAWAPVKVETGTQINAVTGAGETTLFAAGINSSTATLRQLNRIQPW